jgi:hypothetical protein
VHLKRLVRHEIAPLFGRAYLLDARGSSMNTFFRESAVALNGTESLATEWTRILESLTGRRELRYLTMIPWSSVLPWKGLLRRHRAWCSLCYQERRDSGLHVYEQLLWALDVVVACPVHKCLLATVCRYPDCNKPLFPLSAHSRPGHCSNCGRWLGWRLGEPNSISNNLPEEELNWHLWAAESVGELLAAGYHLPSLPGKDRVGRAIESYRSDLGYTNLRAFSLAVSCNYTTVRGWSLDGKQPMLGQLLQMCFGIGVTPLIFLTEEPSSSLRLLRLSSSMPDGTQVRMKAPVAKSRGRNRVQDLVKIEAVLEGALWSEVNPPLSVKELARRLGISNGSGYLTRHFPELCRRIVARYRAYMIAQREVKESQIKAAVRRVVGEIHAEGKYPSQGRVTSRLPDPGWMMASIARDEWREMLRELGWKK